MTQEPQPPVKTAQQERGALFMLVVFALVVATIGAPCFCYFGAGLFQGIHILRTGQTNNPARQAPHQGKEGVDWRGRYKRPDRYNRPTLANPPADTPVDAPANTPDSAPPAPQP